MLLCAGFAVDGVEPSKGTGCCHSCIMGIACGEKTGSDRDGAAWIRLWMGRLVGVDVYPILCWYHLCKRVCEGLSGVGAAKEERKLLQRTILGFLWTGNVDDAVEALKVQWRITRVVSRRDCG